MREPVPAHLRPVITATYVPRAVYDELVRVATERKVSVSSLLREAVTKSFPPAGDGPTKE